jgi:GntR family transcriptional repressor for pyruvate dehydrogenase complex
MPFHPVSSEKLSSAVVRQIEQLVLRGILRAGERLPSER